MIRVGTAGWSYADWEGRVYPRKKPAGYHPLSWLSQYVDAVEINSTFYAPPRREYVQHWNDLAEPFPRLRFIAKVHRDFTHRGLAASTVRAGLRTSGAPTQPPLLEGAGVLATEEARAAEGFLEALEPLRASERLRALLLQFPHRFDRTRAHRIRLARLVELFGAMPLVLELRHRSWFEPRVLRRIEDQGLSVAAIDLPFAADHPPEDAAGLGPIGYLRLHGRNSTHWFARAATRDQRYDYLYDQDELTRLVQRARRIASGKDEAYVITNNHFGGQAVANAIEIRARLEEGPQVAPGVLLDAYPHLRKVAAPYPAAPGQEPRGPRQEPRDPRQEPREPGGPTLFDEV